MKKSEFIDNVAEKAEMSRAAAARAVSAIFDTTSGAIADAIRAGEHLSIPGFGKFTPKKRAARKGRNPQTGKEITIPERNVVRFSAGKGLQGASNGQVGTAKRATAKKSASAGGTATKKVATKKVATKKAATKKAASKTATKKTATKKSAGASGGGARKSAPAAKKSTGGATAKKSGGGTAARKSAGGATAKKSGGGATAKKSTGGAAKKSGGASKARSAGTSR